jgi:hypothetical protein
VSLLLVAAVCVVMFGLPPAANADELKVAKRWAVGLNANPFSGYAPTVEYWTNENFGLSASLSWFYHWSIVGLRGTYLFDTPIHIFSMPARPYAGGGLGFINWSAYGGYASYSSVGVEVFGGLLQPLSDQFSVRAELHAASYSFTAHDWSPGFSPLSVGFGIFYHFGG